MAPNSFESDIIHKKISGQSGYRNHVYYLFWPYMTIFIYILSSLKILSANLHYTENLYLFQFYSEFWFFQYH